MADTHSLRLKPSFPSLDECPMSLLLKKILCADRKDEKSTVIEIAKSINEVDIDTTHLGDINTELSTGNFKLLETVLPDVGHRYAVIRKNGQPLMFAYFQLFTLSPANFNLRADNHFTRTIIKLFTTLKRSKILMLGNALHNEKACYCYDTQSFTADEAVEAVAALAEKIAADECVSATILKEIPPLSAKAGKVFKDNGYIQPFDDNVMEMQVSDSWNNLEDYFKDLSRKYKTRANKIRSSLAGITVKTLSARDITVHEPKIHQLFSAIVAQQPFTLTHPQQGFFSGLKDLYGDSFEVIGYFKDDTLIGFYSAFIEAAAYNVYYIGFDYAQNEQHQLYFNILFSGLERAIELKRPLLQLGRTSFDAKASLGAQPRPLNYLLKMEYIPGFILDRFIKYFASFENTRWKQRNPLKTA